MILIIFNRYLVTKVRPALTEDCDVWVKVAVEKLRDELSQVALETSHVSQAQYHLILAILTHPLTSHLSPLTSTTVPPSFSLRIQAE